MEIPRCWSRPCRQETRTGYNAALLAHRLGAQNVTTIEVDAAQAARAGGALADAGYAGVTVVTGDGAHGYPPRAPYDRILSTAAVGQVPAAWVEQTRPGGRVVTPWGTAYLNGALLALTVGADNTATGRLVDNVAFMCCRALILQTTASFTMPTHGHGHRRHVGGMIVTPPVGDANGRPATRAAGGAAAPLPLLGALGRLRCGSACPRQPSSSMK